MTPTNKGNYIFCIDCKYKIQQSYSLKYPCYYSHSVIRGDATKEREFTTCLLFELKEVK